MAIVCQYSDNIIDKLAKNIIKIKKDRVIVGIAGGSSTGKSTQIAERLCKILAKQSSLLNQDNFQIGRPFVEKQNSPYKWDNPLNFDLDNCFSVLKKISNGDDSIEVPVFSVKDAYRVGNFNFIPNRINIFEGLYAFYDKLVNLCDIKIYVESPMYARLLRRIFRFTHQMSIPHPDKAIKQALTSVFFAHKDCVIQQKNAADFIVRVPYNFQQTYKRFHLKKNNLGDCPSKFIVYRFDVDNSTKIIVQKIEDVFMFFVAHKDKIFFQAPLTNEAWQSLLAADLTTY